MAKEQPQYKTASRVNESKAGSNNNNFQDDFESTVSNDNYSNGMGIARPVVLKEFENVPGSEASDQYMLKDREIKRFNELKSKAFGNPEINNAGIVLDSFGGSQSEGRKSPKDTRGEGKEQKES